MKSRTIARKRMIHFEINKYAGQRKQGSVKRLLIYACEFLKRV